jgi:hypothetical protein
MSNMTNYNATIAALPMPDRIKALPISENGYPTPWFVATIPSTGARDLRVADAEKRVRAVKRGLCWVCGQTLGVRKAFVIGPMCVVNRVTSEPPSHLDCARYSVVACPFLTKPRMRRNDVDLPPEAEDAPGMAIARNPGVTCIWVSKAFERFSASRQRGDWLIRIGQPSSVEWWAGGQPATRAQVEQSIDSGLPILFDMARKDGSSAVAQLEHQRKDALHYYPAAA